MRQTFFLKRGDTSPSLRFVLIPEDTVLTGATVRFNMRSTNPMAVVVNRAAAVIETPTGTPTVRYDWQSVDTATEGTFEAEFEVTYAGGAIETFPNADYITVRVVGDIA